MKPGNSDSPPKTPRRNRVTLEMARCSLGEITNVSATGMCVRYCGSRHAIPRKGRPFQLQVHTLDGMITVPARVAWVKRAGFRRFNVGVEFTDASAETQAKLRQLASTAARSRVITKSSGGAHLRAG
jgi:hypothetical protein